MSLALARKYRPKRFVDVAVQSHVSTTLKGAIQHGRVAHGYLLCGPRGVGKTTLARVLAMALNCERRDDPTLDGEPCGECQSCRRIWSGAASLDVVEIDAASNRGVDDARELRERAMYAPSGDTHFKVYIIDEAHMLTREAWNALLKILEEPPPRVVFVFATTEPQKIAQSAAPVLSRLQRFDFKRIGPGEIRQRLADVLAHEGITAEPEALAAIARAADGSMRDALSLTDQVLSMGANRVTADRVRDALGLVAEDEFIALLDIIAERRAADVFPTIARLAEAGIDFAGLLTGLADMLRAQLAIVLGGGAPDVSERAREALHERRNRFTAADLLRMLAAIADVEPRYRRSGQQQLLVETLLVRLALLDRSVELEEVLRTLNSESSRGSSGGGTVARPVPRSDQRADAPLATSGVADRAPRASIADRPTADSGNAERAPQALRSADAEPLDLNRLVGRWDELVDRLRAAGKPLLATALQHSSPVTVTARGEVTIELDEPNDFYDRAVMDGRNDIVALLREWFGSVERVQLRRDESSPPPTPQRLTDEMVRVQRLAALRKRDPLLGAAIDALDLDVVD
jgi:DNA polymerase-3 subunit gamma/tau